MIVFRGQKNRIENTISPTTRRTTPQRIQERAALTHQPKITDTIPVRIATRPTGPRKSLGPRATAKVIVVSNERGTSWKTLGWMTKVTAQMPPRKIIIAHRGATRDAKPRDCCFPGCAAEGAAGALLGD